jgi:hypothetical protein
MALQKGIWNIIEVIVFFAYSTVLSSSAPKSLLLLGLFFFLRIFLYDCLQYQLSASTALCVLAISASNSSNHHVLD